MYERHEDCEFVHWGFFWIDVMLLVLEKSTSPSKHKYTFELRQCRDEFIIFFFYKRGWVLINMPDPGFWIGMGKDYITGTRMG